MKKILIAGGSGLVGTQILRDLADKDYEMSILTHSKKFNADYKYFYWNPLEGILPKEALIGTDIIINMSGAGIGNKPWTKKRKVIIEQSRIMSTRLLVSAILENKITPSLFINASAIGYYGDRPNEKLIETSKAGTGFLSNLCLDWENELAPLLHLKIPVATLRFGIILSNSGGSLPKLISPLKFRLNFTFGKGLQHISWVHIKDVSKIIFALIDTKLQARTYNVVAPKPVRQKTFNQKAINVLQKRCLKIRIPRFLLQLVLSDLSSLFLDDLEVIPEGLIKQNFRFEYTDIEDALENLLAGS